MKERYGEEAVVRIWRNKKVLGFVPTPHVGHASVSLRTKTYMLNNDFSHISWWPKNGAGFFNAFSNQPGLTNKNYRGDKVDEISDRAVGGLERGYQARLTAPQDPLPRGAHDPRPGQKRIDVNQGPGFAWLQSADAKFYLPAIGAKLSGKPLYWGISSSRMCTWWKTWQPMNEYRLASATHNCAGVVALALEAGGATVFAKGPKAIVYMEPRMIESWARELEKSLALLNMTTEIFDGEVTRYLDAFKTEFAALKVPQPKAGELWTESEFKTASALFLKPRSSLLGQIDSALAKYHSLSWKDSDFGLRLQALFDLVEKLREHRQAKEDSERAVALCALAKQALTILKSPPAEMKYSNQ